MTINKIIAFVVRVLILFAFTVLIFSCSPGKYCEPGNIKSGRSSQHHDSKKFKVIAKKQEGPFYVLHVHNMQYDGNLVFEGKLPDSIQLGKWYCL
jgi:hypothetical protein